MSEIESRLQHLERELGRLRRAWRRRDRVIVALLGMLGLFALAGTTRLADDPADLRAKSLTLVDSHGKERIILDVEDDLPNLVMRDHTSEKFVGLGFGPADDLALVMRRERGKETASIGIGSDGVARVVVDGGKEHARAILDASKDNEPSLTMLTATGDCATRIGITSTGSGLAVFNDEGSKARVGIGCLGGRPNIQIIGGDNHPGALLGMFKNGAIGLAMHDKANNPRVALGISENDVPFLDLLDENGKVSDRVGHLPAEQTPQTVKPPR